MGLANSLLAVFAFIAASCSERPPEVAEHVGQVEAALGTEWQATTPMLEQRRYHSATVLASNKVLVVGGWGYNDMVAEARTYEPVSATWSSAGALALAREAHTATRLSSGKVLVVGGDINNPYPNNFHADAELQHASRLLPRPHLRSLERLQCLRVRRAGHAVALRDAVRVLRWCVRGVHLHGGSGLQQASRLLPGRSVLLGRRLRQRLSE